MSRNRQQENTFAVLPQSIRQRGEALLDQQMWCWGCDVRYETGNLLLAYGFEQRSSPNPRFHSAYTAPINSHCTLTLWGWGAWVADVEYGSLFISRTRFQLRHTEKVILTPCVWQACDLPSDAMFPSSLALWGVRHLLVRTLLWTANYERWIQENLGVEYRERVLAVYPQRKHSKGGTPADQIAARWDQLALHFDQSANK